MTRLSIPELGTILGVWAHPDDEAYLSAGVMAVARDAGQRVVVATATRGEAGTSDPQQWPPRRLGRVREHELHASLAALGVTEHHFLGYVDGTLDDVDPEAAIAHIAALMVTVQPDTILTFGPDGITGHSDHRRVSEWTLEARDRIAPTARLLYPAYPTTHSDRWQELYDECDIFMEPDLPVRPPPEDVAFELTLHGALADRKLVAMRAQASQTTGLIEAMGEQTYRAWISAEGFVEAPSTPRPSTGTRSVAASRPS